MAEKDLRGGGEPEATATREARPRAPLTQASRRYWRLDWSEILPWSFEDIAVEQATLDEILPFMAETYADIFGEEKPRWIIEPMTPAKRRYLEEADCFVFRSAGRPIGISVAHPTDWSTYYIRTFAILPEFRERRFATAFYDHVAKALRAVGVARLEAECSPANQPMTKLFISHQCIVTATVNSERWGTMLRFTKFLDSDAEEVFRRQFVSVPAYGRKPQPR